MRNFNKDSQALLDYIWDWSDWLGTDIIDEYVFTVPEGITLESSSEEEGKIVAWISGGTLNSSYPVTCKITTVGGRTEEASAVFNMVFK